MAATAAALAPARADINRANAQHSTGPRTEEGKAASSQNALKHGLFTSLSALPAYEREILDLFLADFGPTPEASRELADVKTRWAILRYRIDKCQRLDFAAQQQLILRHCEENEITLPTDPIELAQLEAQVFIDDECGHKVLTRLHNYEARLQRELHRTIKEHNDLLTLEASLATPRYNPVEADLASFFQSESQPESDPAQTPRNAACPCGSGEKHKRCCGKNAPPALHYGA